MKYVTYRHPKYGELRVPIDPPLRENVGALAGRKPEDYVVGATSPLSYEIIRPDFDWRPWIVLPEKQYYAGFDTFACTNYADNNQAEIQLLHATGYEFNFSDRASAVLSGTLPGQGNYMTAAPDRSRKYGRILEKDWPNDAGSGSVSEWYKPVPTEVQQKAIHFKENYEWVEESLASIQHHLKHAPLGIMIKAGSTYHDICAVFADSNGIWYFDSYPHGTLDNHLAITTQVPLAALKIIVKPMTNVKLIKNGTEWAFYVPATNEQAMIDKALNFGYALPTTDNGSKVDWLNVKPDITIA